jgi:uncharacterized protein
MWMRFEWDEEKNRANLVKHGVSFQTAKQVFDDPYHVSLMDRVEDSEQRWLTFGMVGGLVVLAVAHTFLDAEGEVIRIISARRATRRERRNFEDG